MIQQGLPDRVGHRVRDCHLVVEADSHFPGVNVHVDGVRWDGHEEHGKRVSVPSELFSIRFEDGGPDRVGSHVTAVDVGRHVFGPATVRFGIAHEPRNRRHRSTRRALDLDHVFRDLSPVDSEHRLLKVPAPGGGKHLVVVVGQGDRNRGVGERVAGHDPVDVAEFGGDAFEVLPPRGRIVKEIGHRDRRARGAADRGQIREFATFDPDLPADIRALALPRFDGHPGDSPDRVEGLPSKSKRAHTPLEVVDRADLARRMLLDGPADPLLGHALAVVRDPDQIGSVAGNGHVDAIGSGVQTVFDEFLDHGGGPFDHLAGRDLRDRRVVEAGDISHRSRVGPAIRSLQ